MPADRSTACLDFRRAALTRRQLLQVGTAGLAGLSLPHWLRAAEKSRGSVKAKAKSVILLHQYGGPSQLETFDMKPAMPAEIRGAFKPIPSALPGIPVCELLPRMAPLSRANHGTFDRFPDEDMIESARAAMPDVDVEDAVWLDRYDAYYYDRGGELSLPVLRVRFADPARTWSARPRHAGCRSVRREHGTRDRGRRRCRRRIAPSRRQTSRLSS